MSSFSEEGIDGGVMNGKEEEGEEVEDGSALTKARAAVWSYIFDGFGVRKGGGSGGDKGDVHRRATSSSPKVLMRSAFLGCDGGRRAESR